MRFRIIDCLLAIALVSLCCALFGVKRSFRDTTQRLEFFPSGCRLLDAQWGKNRIWTIEPHSCALVMSGYQDGSSKYGIVDNDHYVELRQSLHCIEVLIRAVKDHVAVESHRYPLDAHSLASVGPGGRIEIWGRDSYEVIDPRGMQRLARFIWKKANPGPLSMPGLIDGDTVVAYGLANGGQWVRVVYSLSERRILWTQPILPVGPAICIPCGVSRLVVATMSGGCNVEIVDRQTGERQACCARFNIPAWAVESRDGRHVMVGDSDSYTVFPLNGSNAPERRSIRVRSWVESKLKWAHERATGIGFGQRCGCAVSPDQTLLAFPGGRGEMIVYDLESGRRIRSDGNPYTVTYGLLSFGFTLWALLSGISWRGRCRDAQSSSGNLYLVTALWGMRLVAMAAIWRAVFRYGMVRYGEFPMLMFAQRVVHVYLALGVATGSWKAITKLDLKRLSKQFVALVIAYDWITASVGLASWILLWLADLWHARHSSASVKCGWS